MGTMTTATTPTCAPASMPHDLAIILDALGNEWINICRDFVTWQFKGNDNQELIYSPMACDREETQMGFLLRAFERAYPMLPKMCEFGVTRKKTGLPMKKTKNKKGGNEHADLWFSYLDEHSKSVEVYVEGKWTTAKWKSAKAKFEWYKMTPWQQAADGEKQAKEIDFSGDAVGLTHKRVVALFVLFGLPVKPKESRETWNERIERCLGEEEGWIDGRHPVQRDFDAGDRWECLRRCAPMWEKNVPFWPRARLYMYEVPEGAGE